MPRIITLINIRLKRWKVSLIRAYQVRITMNRVQKQNTYAKCLFFYYYNASETLNLIRFHRNTIMGHNLNLKLLTQNQNICFFFRRHFFCIRFERKKRTKREEEEEKFEKRTNGVHMGVDDMNITRRDNFDAVFLMPSSPSISPPSIYYDSI